VDLLLSSDNKREKDLRELVYFVQSERNYWKMSYVIPGSGQILSGNLWDGIFSFLWNSGSVYLMYDGFKKEDMLGGCLSLLVFLRFYIGNIYSSKKYEKENRLKEFRISMESLKKDYLRNI